MEIAFTGTRQGMTDNQKVELVEWLEKLKPTKVYHGDCIGADTDFHHSVRKFDPEIFVHIIPSNIADQRSFLKGDKVEDPNHPLVRNRDMVDNADIVIAAPATLEEVLRSGTWATIRYARKLKKEVILLKPEASTLESLFT